VGLHQLESVCCKGRVVSGSTKTYR